MFENLNPDDIVEGGNGKSCTVAEFNMMSKGEKQAFMEGKTLTPGEEWDMRVAEIGLL